MIPRPLRALGLAALALSLAAPPALAAKAKEPGHSESIAPPFSNSKQQITPKGRIHYVASGPEDGPAVVLVHGFPDHAQQWLPVVDALDETYRVYAVDLAGCGHSGRPDFVDYEVAGLADYLLTFFDTVEIGRAHLVGLDLGMQVVLRFAASNPKRVDHLVVGAGPAAPGAPLPELLGRLESSMSGEAEAGRLKATLAPYVKGGLGPGAAVSDEAVTAMLEPLTGKGAKKSLLRWVRSVTPEVFRLRQPAPALSGTPALVLWGELDPYFPPAGAPSLAAHLPRSQVKTLPGVGHFPVLESPKAVAEALLAFLPRPVVDTVVAEIPLAGWQGETVTAKVTLRNERKRRARLTLAPRPFERVGEPVVLPGRKPLDLPPPEALALDTAKLTLEPGKEAEVTLTLVLDPRHFQFGERYLGGLDVATDVKGLEVPPVTMLVRVLRIEDERPPGLHGDAGVAPVARALADPPPPEKVGKE